jgi:outer membrane biosynthesis protein TonB
VRIFATIFTCAVLLATLSAPAQTTPAAPAPEKPCVPNPTAVANMEETSYDVGGVDMKPYIRRIYRIVQSSWNPLVPKEAGPPVNKSGEVLICFKILPNGHLMEGGMVLGGRSGDVALDRAAWGAIATSVYPPLPTEFKEPFLEVRFQFFYNPDRKQTPSRQMPSARNLLGPVGVVLGYNSKAYH